LTVVGPPHHTGKRVFPSVNIVPKRYFIGYTFRPMFDFVIGMFFIFHLLYLFYAATWLS